LCPSHDEFVWETTMENKKRVGHIPLGILAGLATVVLASGGATAWFTWRALNPKPPMAEFPSLETVPDNTATVKPDVETPVEPPVAPPDIDKEPTAQAPVADVSGQIYWLQDDGTSLQLVPESFSVAGQTAPAEQVKAAFSTLLSKTGDPEQDAFTTIPAGTQLLEATVAADGVHVDLSGDFQSGGGSASMIGRLGQVIYTATAFDPDAAVWISVDGKPLTLMGGEGLEVNQPMTREEFEQSFQL
jgi:spore germination protein GerM